MKRWRRRWLCGFTLIELVVVMAIIAFLAGLIMVAVQGARKRASSDKARAQITQLETAIQMYKSDYGIFPISGNSAGQENANRDRRETGGKELGNLVRVLTSDALGGPYISFKGKDLNANGTDPILLDPWGRAYVYTCRKYIDASVSPAYANDVDVTMAPFWPNTSATSRNTYNIYSLGPDAKTLGGAGGTTEVSGPTAPDDANAINHQNAGNAKSAANKDDQRFDDINNW